jgi:hypothetical protein
MEVVCIFCGKDMSDLKFQEDYVLLAWTDDPDEPTSMNKLAKPAHIDCYVRFAELNNLRHDK